MMIRNGSPVGVTANSHFHKKVVAFIEIALPHANSNRQLSRSLNPVPLNPGFGYKITSLMDNVGGLEGNGQCLPSECAHKSQS